MIPRRSVPFAGNAKDGRYRAEGADGAGLRRTVAGWWLIAQRFWVYAVVLMALASNPSQADPNMGMRIESVSEVNGEVTVTTTGAKFFIDHKGVVGFWQRIPRERKLLETRLPRPASRFRIDRKDSFTVTVAYEGASVTINGDSLAMVTLNQDFSMLFQGLIAPSYTAENYKGRRLLIDTDGGFGLYPLTPNLSSSMDRMRRVTYRFTRGEEIWVSIFPPRPYNWQRSFEPVCHEGNVDIPYPLNTVIQSDASHCKIFILHAYFWQDDPIDVFDDDGLLVPHPHPWTVPVHIPTNMTEFRRVRDEVRRNGMKFLVYVAPYYSRSPDIMREVQRIVDEYDVDGFYFDGFAREFPRSYELARQTRQILGPDRILCNHDSFGRGWRYPDELVYFPLVDAYSDYIMRGESGRLRFGLHDFLRWIVSGYNISNAIGYWIYYGSNIDDVNGGPECVYEGRVCCEDGLQVCYQIRVPTEPHIIQAVENEVHFERMGQNWSERGLEGELPRFDRQYYDRVDSLRRAWNDSARFSVNDQIQTTAQVEIRATPSPSGPLLGTQASGAGGRILDGPAFAGGILWWNIRYDSGPNGWTAHGPFIRR